ncbi:Secreted beta-glucosidase sun1 [Cyphellophora attinorum]|uniref:Secreted beta-glucosidase sun1 n=1 Tax=Cyphellophora attinorum TaxID=1664694 RepID=A0A0N1HUT3_9EURO|nr:Secreted beta-glucosidase sun1 [Phialophora attinorum]KPI43256.1 Secreted beta-glucosidase sun1 [Phialophora attinorum]
MKRFLIAASAVVATANPHLHKHRHLHEHAARAAATVTDIVATKIVFEALGTPLSQDEACSKVAAGLLTWKNSADATVCSQPAQTSAPPPPPPPPASSSSSPSAGAGQFFNSPPAVGAPAAAPSGGAWTDSSVTGLNADFPDGTLDCGTFPSAYGAMPVPYMGMNGWIGLQDVGAGVSGAAINTIHTLLAGDNCREASCAPGQSVGGLACSGGKLRLTNTSTKKLCDAGMGGVQAQNQASGVVAICRTDYPGTEAETVPMSLQPGSTQPMNNPNGATGYQWQGKSTSAQYYLNPIGTSAENGCKWGDGSQPIGNWAPINLGVGFSDGKTWLSIFQNKPTQLAPYQGKVQITGDIGNQVCSYENGVYTGVSGSNGDGCTVAVNAGGSATYVISN